MFGTIIMVRRGKNRIELRVCFSVLLEKTKYPRDSMRNKFKLCILSQMIRHPTI